MDKMCDKHKCKLEFRMMHGKGAVNEWVCAKCEKDKNTFTLPIDRQDKE